MASELLRRLWNLPKGDASTYQVDTTRYINPNATPLQKMWGDSKRETRQPITTPALKIHGPSNWLPKQAPTQYTEQPSAEPMGPTAPKQDKAPSALPAFTPMQEIQYQQPKFNNKVPTMNEYFSQQGIPQSNSYLGALMNLGLGIGGVAAARGDRDAENEFAMKQAEMANKGMDTNARIREANARLGYDYTKMGQDIPENQAKLGLYQAQAEGAKQEAALGKMKLDYLSKLPEAQRNAAIMGSKDQNKEYDKMMADMMMGIAEGKIPPSALDPKMKDFFRQKGLNIVDETPVKKGWFD